MKMPVWRCIVIVVCGLASALACAQVRDFPNKSVRIVVPVAPGGILDMVARVLSPKMSELMGQTVLVDNRPGAGLNIGTEIVAKAPGDGYTLLLQANPLVFNPALYQKLRYDVEKDLTAVSLLVSGVPYLLVVHPSVPAKSVKELIALAKARPGALNYSTGGNGSNIHIAGELFKNMTGTDIVHVPYKAGGEVLGAVLSGEAGVTFFALALLMPHVKAGKVRALAVTSTKRSALAPGLPTVAEAGVPGYEFIVWVGMLAPSTTPANIIAALNGYIVKAVRGSDLTERFANEGGDVIASSPEHYNAFLKTELARWSKSIKAMGIRAD
jgi:tripartite-type tricarboxylate transporter receptor subunit TctC